MPLFRVTAEKLESVEEVSFSDVELWERRDLQRMLKSDMSPLGDDLFVVADEFGDWEDSNRRIDLLCLDRDARLVVVEIKRTEDGGHMELQAIRYASMVSTMTLEQVIRAHARTLRVEDPEAVARRKILSFLNAESVDHTSLAGHVRIVLVSAEFSVELTTAVLWLSENGIDIRCVRLKPYRLGDQVLVDATQILPLPEAEEYTVRVRETAQENRKARTARQELFRRFWAQYIERSRSRTQMLTNRATTTDHWLSAGIGRSGFSLSSSLTEDRARVECYIRLGKDSDERNMTVFKALLASKAAIEEDFGAALSWQDLPDRIGCRICYDMEGGWKTPEDDWPVLQDRMIDNLVRLERALKDRVAALDL